MGHLGAELGGKLEDGVEGEVGEPGFELWCMLAERNEGWVVCDVPIGLRE